MDEIVLNMSKELEYQKMKELCMPLLCYVYISSVHRIFIVNFFVT